MATVRTLLPLAALTVALLAPLHPRAARAQIGGCTPDFSHAVTVDIETSLGTIPVEFYPEMAPFTVRNFVAYAARGDFDGTLIHRSVPGFVIQGGGFREESGAYATVPTDPALDNEPCLSNTRGTVAMARLGGLPDSATNQWFINLVDNLFLDATDGVGFTAFARVVGNGMSVVDAIAVSPIFDPLTILEIPYNQIFRDLPLQNLPTDPPGGYGCARDTPLHGLADEVIDTIEIDPLRSGSAVVPILLDPLCTGAGVVAPPSVPCTVGVGRDVFLVNLITQQLFHPRIPMTCDQVAEAELSWVDRRTGTAPQLFTEDIEIIAVPEPGTFLQISCGCVGLVALAHRKRGREALTEKRVNVHQRPRSQTSATLPTQ